MWRRIASHYGSHGWADNHDDPENEQAAKPKILSTHPQEILPQTLTERGVKLSLHPVIVNQPLREKRSTSEQIAENFLLSNFIQQPQAALTVYAKPMPLMKKGTR